MALLTTDAIAIDCPEPYTLAAFYAGLLETEAENDYVILPSTNLWFQPVENYQPPTWPTQERGQQLHLDFAAADHSTIIAKALSLGATLTERMDGYHYPILLDPAGHPFCLVSADESEPKVKMVTLNFDCDDVSELVGFYHRMLGGTIETYSGWSNLVRDDEITLSFQKTEGYLPPTWPTQERGQQMHIDFHSDNRVSAVKEVIRYGAKLMEEHERFSVLLDPAGHPFCIWDSRQSPHWIDMRDQHRTEKMPHR